MTDQNVWILIAVFGTVSAGIYLILARMDPYQLRVRKRMSRLSGDDTATAEPLATEAVENKDNVPASKLAAAISAPFRFGSQSEVRKRLAMAGLRSRSAHTTMLLARVGLTVVPLAVAAYLIVSGRVPTATGVFWGLVASTFGWLIPVLYLNQAIARYRILLRSSLPDFLDVVIVCLDAGSSLQESLRRVTQELQSVHPELAQELGLVQRDVELGLTVEAALRRFADRTEYDAVRTLGSLIREAQRLGTNITDALRGHADLLRYQREQAAEEQAQKASVKIMLPMMLCIFPAIFVVLVSPAAIQIHQAFSGQ